MSEKQKTVDYKHAEVKSLLKNLSPDTSGGLILLTGTNRSSKARFVGRFAKKLNRNVLLVDSRELVSRDIDRYRESMDRLVESIRSDSSLLLFLNSDLFSGNYTNFTNSSVRYATPQSRYLISLLQKTDRWVLMDVEDEVNVDLTMKRYADLQIQFGDSPSLFEKLRGGDEDYEGEMFRFKKNGK